MYRLLFFSIVLSFTFSLKAQFCQPSTAITTLDVNNFHATLLAGGDLWWDGNQDAGAEFPASSGGHVLYSGAIWMSALDDFDQLYMAAQTYRNQGHDFWTGPILPGNMTQSHCAIFDRFFEVTRADLDIHLQNIADANGAQLAWNDIPLSILEWPAKENIYLFDQGYLIGEPLAPFVDVNNNGTYEPWDGDYPKIKGDQCIFWVLNDKGNVHNHTIGAALNVEIQCMAYAYSTSDILNDCTFYDYKIVNKSGRDYHDFIFSQFVDVDLGGATDDFVGCDTLRNMGFVYNSGTPDAGYGLNIPVAGISMLQTPNDEPMSSMLYFSNSSGPQSDPSGSFEYRNFQEAKWGDGSIPIASQGCIGTFGQYAYPGNPSDLSGVSECTISGAGNGSDRRFVMNSAFYDLLDGECLSFTIGTIARMVDNYQPCPDIDSLLGQKVDEVKILMGEDLVDASCIVDENPIVVNPAIRDLANSDKIKIAPNSSSGLVQISGVEVERVVLYDLAGKILLETKENKLNVAILSEGIYLLQVMDENDVLYRAKKVMVVK